MLWVEVAEVSVVDAAEFRRAHLVLAELCLLEPLRLLAECVRNSRWALAWSTPGNAWAAVFDKEPSGLTRDDALTLAGPCLVFQLQQARGKTLSLLAVMILRKVLRATSYCQVLTLLMRLPAWTLWCF